MRTQTVKKRKTDLFFADYLSPEAIKEYPLFIPNSGSQETLFFDLLNCDRQPDGSILSKPYQQPYFAIYYRAGIGSGKTYSGSAFCVSRSELYPNAIGLITANSFPQLKNSTLRGLAKFCHEYGINLEPCSSDYKETAKRIAFNQHCKINGVWHDVLSADSFTGKTESSKEAGRGTEYAWAWLDEFSYANESAFETISGRLRWVGLKPHLLITSTINRNNPFNWAYQLFDDPDRDINKQKLFISLAGSTLENKHNLSEDYVDRLQASLTPELFAIEINSEYVALTSDRIFRYFNRNIHLLAENINPKHPLHLGFDFNWNPATCLVSQYIDGVLVILKEFYLRESDTFELIKTVTEYLNGINHQESIYIHGDASGNQRTANSNLSNWEIIWKGLKTTEFTCIKAYKNVNPSIDESIISVNALLSHNRLFVHPQCKELIKDLEVLKKKNDKIDKSDTERSHEADILRYITQDLAPYRAGLQLKEGYWS
jgi:phage terminase large subunit